MPTRTNSSAARARASSSPATAGNGATTDCPEAVVLAGLIEALEGLARGDVVGRLPVRGEGPGRHAAVAARWSRTGGAAVGLCR